MDVVWAAVVTKSYVAVLSPSEQAKIKEDMIRLILKYFPHMGDDSIHSAKKVVDMPYNTDIYWVEKRT